MATRCPGCMKLKEKSPVCEHCGYNENVPNYSHQLPVGTKLHGQYTVGKVLGQGGFGITYIGWDDNLDIPLAIKEYYPSGIVSRDNSYSLEVTSTGYNTEIFQNNRERFMREARAMAKLTGIPGIVKIYNYFPENNTAYITMEYVQGTDLKRYIKMQGRPLTPKETFAILRPVMDALSKVHEAGLVHRDISPDNIMIQRDGQAKLLDFGAVREVKDADVAKNLSRSTESILKHGYAPIEQYQRRGNLGPWTDIYALCATVYYCLTQDVPPDAPERMIELPEVAWEKIDGLTEKQMEVFRHGMALLPRDRIISIDQLRQELFPPEPERIPEPEVEPAIPEPPVEEAPKHPEPVREQREAVPTVMMLTPQKPEELPAAAPPEPEKPSRQEMLKRKPERLEAERREKEKQLQRREQARLEAERLERERQERWKQEQLRQEQEKKAQLRQEKERRDREKQEQLRLEQEQWARLEAQRLEKQRLEKERREAAKQEKRRQEAQRREAEQRQRQEEQHQQEEEKQQRRQAQLERRRVRQVQKQAETEAQSQTASKPRKKRRSNAILVALALLALLGTAIFLLKPEEEAILQEPVGETVAETMETVGETLPELVPAATDETLPAEAVRSCEICTPNFERDQTCFSYQAEYNGDQLVIESENLYVKVIDNQNITVTVSGLDIANSYPVNLPESSEKALEYDWKIYFVADRNWSISTSSWAFHPGENGVKAISDMQHTLWMDKGDDYYYVAEAQMTSTSDSITWTCVIPWNYSIDFTKLEQIAVHVTNVTEDNHFCRVYNPASGAAESTSSEEAPSAYMPAKNPTYAPDAWKNNMLIRNALSVCKGLRKTEIQSVIVLDTIEEAPAERWDISQKQDGSVLAWTHQNGDVKELYLAADGGINAYWGSNYGQKDPGVSFQGFDNVEVIRFNGFFHIDQLSDLTKMFSGCSKLKTLDIENWNTSNIVNMYATFAGCASLKELDLSNWKTTNLFSTGEMFSRCKNLTKLDFSGWSTAGVRHMESMFQNCSSLAELDLSGWNTSRVKNMENMFSGCSSLTKLDISKFTTENVESMAGMFAGCSTLTELDISGFRTGNVYSMASMFSGCSSLAKLDISSFRTGGVRNMASMFEGCSSLTALDLSHFNTYRVNYMENMFRDCENLMTLNLSKWVVSSAYNMSYMFAGCKSLTELDLSGWKPFRGCLHTDFMEPGKTINGRPWEEFFQ